MNNYIKFTKIWSDEDVIELEIKTSNGSSLFTNTVYISYATLEKTVSELDKFKTQIYGGIYDIEFGTFGPEYANGAFQARLHFAIRNSGKIYISVKAETDFEEFANKKISERVELYLKTEPSLLDNFINEMKSLNSNISKDAELKCI
jgi:hypothetical protein